MSKRAMSAADVESTECLHQGVLEVRTASLLPSMFRCWGSTWAPFYFQLTRDNLLLKYDVSREGGLLGPPMTVSSVDARDSNDFEISVNSGETMLLKAPSHTSRAAWVRCLSSTLPDSATNNSRRGESGSQSTTALGVNVYRSHTSTSSRYGKQPINRATLDHESLLLGNNES